MNILAEDYEHLDTHWVPQIGDWWLLLLIAILVVVVAAIVLFMFLRRRSREDEHEQASPCGINPAVRNAGPSAECETQILAMLKQKGAPVSQMEVVENLGMPESEVVAALAELEECGLIRRRWDRDRYTYLVEDLR